MRILAFDLAGSTGWASFETLKVSAHKVGLTNSGVLYLKLRDDEHPGARWVRARSKFRELVQGADLVAWEKVVANSGPLASGELFALQAQLAEAVFLAGVPRTLTVAPNTLKKFAVGNGRAEKKEMLAAARARWPEHDLETHDQADALFVLAWAMEQEKSHVR
jgi:Holliday junction resolvasome RuvABC endonuclease subunit